MTDLRSQARGPRVVRGEKRSETIKGTITYSDLIRTEANASRIGVARSRYVDMAVQMLNEAVESGAVPTGPMEHWQRLANAAQTALLSVRETIDRQVAALSMIDLAAGAEIAEAEMNAQADGERGAA